MWTYQHCPIERHCARPLYLVSAAEQTIVDQVAYHLELFDDAWGSDGQRNLKGATKRRLLNEKMPDGYVYAGDSRADLAVWESAQSAILISSDRSLQSKVRAVCPIEHEIAGNKAQLQTG